MPPRPVHRSLWLICLWFRLASTIHAQDAPPHLPAIHGIENLRQVAPGILSGSQPEGADAFAELARRGVKVIISVDGSTPDVELAHKAGLRYVHVPIGYDKIGPQQRADLVEATKTANGPFFLHCHHGKHRGPAAAAYCGMALGKLTGPQALDALKQAGTKADYTGLWDAIRQFEPPQVPAGPLVEVAKIEPTTAAMVRIDHHWGDLEAVIKSGTVRDWDSLQKKTLLFTEEFRELTRTSPLADEKYQARMTTATVVAEELLMAAKASNYLQLKSVHQKVLQSCVDCHTNHRDH